MNEDREFPQVYFILHLENFQQSGDLSCITEQWREAHSSHTYCWFSKSFQNPENISPR